MNLMCESRSGQSSVFSAKRGVESLGESSLDLTLRDEVAAEAEPAREVRLNLKMMSWHVLLFCREEFSSNPA